MNIITLLKHLKKIEKEIKTLEHDIETNPRSSGFFEQRLHFAIRGVNPRKAICVKHNKKLKKNQWGEFVCPDCIDELISNKVPINDDDWYEPGNEPQLKLTGIKYGINL